MANRPARRLELRDGDRARLLVMTRSPTVRAGLARRARIVLLAADGLSNTDIADKVGVSRPTVLEWRHRYAERGLDGLADLARPGRRPHASATDVLRATLVPPPRRLGVTHWSSRLLGRELGVGRSTVVRGWHTYGLQPIRGGYRFATSPPLVGRVTSILALRLGARERFAVLDVRDNAWTRDRADAGVAAAALADLEHALLRGPAPVRDDPAGDLATFLDHVNSSRAHWPTGAQLHLVTEGYGQVAATGLREALGARSRIAGLHAVREPTRWADLVAAWLWMISPVDPDPGPLLALERGCRRMDPGSAFAWCYAPGRAVKAASTRPTVN
ncbi:helix-turn-helix domain-containing protein [Nocardioides sp. YIM 152315]|uniref:helix-turn-helix domain-containing protein n=1 Tax=Nocardioides sp. YIM 152315 TaxID=3031760 RepID=UPI0023DC4B8A|nr:helix-turn-helix domain-containing protein [Nocardioides sp. YIM 152315]MDF1603302.1 helix-turn-helix domain-containing protein [Nocardioides sp. YIM 152315]